MRNLRRALFVGACLATLIALFYAVENWRGQHAWQKYRRELEAKGEVINWDAFIPAPVPDDQNFYKAPRMAEWFVKQSIAEAISSQQSKAGDASAPFKLAPRQNPEAGPVLVAEVQVITSQDPAPPGKADAVLRLDDPAASEKAAQLIRQHLGPCAEGPTGCLVTTRPLDHSHPVYLVLQADKIPTTKALAEFLPRSPVPHSFYGPNPPEYFQIEAAGSNGFLVSIKPTIYTAKEYLDLSQGAVSDFDLLRKALERPYARMDSDYQRPYEHPVPNFVRLRTSVQMLAQRTQCYLLLGQPEAAWHELALVRDTCHMLEAKPASHCPTLVEAMISVAIGGLYVTAAQDGFRLQAWREPELVAMQNQLKEIDFIPLLQRSFQAERAANIRLVENYTPAQLRKAFDFGHQKRLWDKLSNPTFLFVTLAPRGWFYQNIVSADPHGWTALYRAFDTQNSKLLPDQIEAHDAQVRQLKAHPSPYTYLATLALPSFLKAVQTMARNQTLANQAYIVCGLERYRLAHKQYPKSLEELVPQFAEKLPHEIIGGAPLKYERSADDRFELYSIGWNAKDDHGFPGKTIAEGDWVWP
jgi:hypothetical protein